MAKGITGGVIKEAIRKLGGISDDVVRTVGDIADAADMMPNPRSAFHSMIDDFGGIKSGDGFTMRRANLYGSDAPVYTGGEMRIPKLKADDVEVIPPSWDRSSVLQNTVENTARLNGPVAGDTLRLGGPVNGDTLRLDGPTYRSNGTPLLEESTPNFQMGADNGSPRYTGPADPRKLPVPVNSNTGLAQRRLDNTADVARDAYIDQDITSRMKDIDAANAAERAKSARDKIAHERLARDGYDTEGKRLSFMERRRNKKHFAQQDRVDAAYAYADAQLNPSSNTSGISEWAHENQLIVAGAIAGGGILGAALLTDD